MGSTVSILIAALALCVALSAFFSASETAYAAANRVRLKTMAQDGDRKAARALALAEDYDRLLTSILVGNNLVNIAGTAIATVLFTGWVGDLGPTLSTVVMTLVILLFGEISPKTLAKQFAEQVAASYSFKGYADALALTGQFDAFLYAVRKFGGQHGNPFREHITGEHLQGSRHLVAESGKQTAATGFT
jgi:Mg2+/Co2+ transporter CorB